MCKDVNMKSMIFAIVAFCAWVAVLGDTGNAREQQLPAGDQPMPQGTTSVTNQTTKGPGVREKDHAPVVEGKSASDAGPASKGHAKKATGPNVATNTEKQNLVNVESTLKELVAQVNELKNMCTEIKERGSLDGNDQKMSAGPLLKSLEELKGSVENLHQSCREELKAFGQEQQESLRDLVAVVGKGDVGNKRAPQGDWVSLTVLAIVICSFVVVGFCAVHICRSVRLGNEMRLSMVEAIDGAALRIENRVADSEGKGEKRGQEVLSRVDEVKSTIVRVAKHGTQAPQSTVNPAAEFFKGASRNLVASSNNASSEEVGLVAELERQNRELTAAMQRLEDEKSTLEADRKKCEGDAAAEKTRYRTELERIARDLQAVNAAKDEMERKYEEAMAKCRKYEAEMTNLCGVYGFKDDPAFLPLMEKLTRWSRENLDDVALVKSALVIVRRGEKASMETFMGALKDLAMSLSSLLLAEGVDEKDVEKELRTWAVYVQKFSTPNRQFTLQVPSIGAPIDTSSMKVISGNPSVVGGIRSWAVYGAFSIQYMAEVV